MSKIIKNEVIIIFLLLSGISGAILFLPLNPDSGYTCFYHRLFNHDHPVLQHDSKAILMKPEVTQEQREIEHGNHSYEQKLLNKYIKHYAVFWWGSLGLAAFGAYQMHNRYSSRKQKLN